MTDLKDERRKKWIVKTKRKHTTVTKSIKNPAKRKDRIKIDPRTYVQEDNE